MGIRVDAVSRENRLDLRETANQLIVTRALGYFAFGARVM
jgi:hypothetical protein